MSDASIVKVGQSKIWKVNITGFLLLKLFDVNKNLTNLFSLNSDFGNYNRANFCLLVYISAS